MAIDPVSMTSLLSRLDAARQVVARFPALTDLKSAVAGEGAAAAPAKPVDFAGMLKASIDRVDQSEGAAMRLAERFQLGDPKVSLEDSMVALSKANISFTELVQVRNRMIAAYHEVMNMQV